MSAVAIVGAGAAGLSCGRALAEAGVSAVIFDKGRGVGGRLATRRAAGVTFDHGAQFFTVRAPTVQGRLDAWARGAVAVWDGPFVRLGEGDPAPVEGDRRWVGAPTMTALPKALAEGLDVRTGVRVAPLRERSEGRWALVSDAGDDLGRFDTVLLTAPAPQARALLPPEAERLAETIASAAFAPCWTVLVQLGRTFELGFAAAEIRGDGPLGWVARNGTKAGRPAGEAWVLHAGAAWSATHLEDRPERVVDVLVAAFRERFGAPDPIAAVPHRWRYARVTSALGVSHLHDADIGLGVAGDYCLGPRVEAAVQSGLALAKTVLNGSGRPGNEAVSRC